MCGIVGMAGDLTLRHTEKVFRDMLDVCQVRGRHSTGVIKIDTKLERDWVKMVGPPSALCDSRSYEDRIERGVAAALIGHCRHRTVGDISTKTAHPFEIGHITGVHNGTLSETHKLDTYTYQKVDSEVLFGHLAENGAEDTFATAKGAFACVWWDDNDKTLNFIRNDKRPLIFTWSKDLKAMFWASEAWMFGAVERHVELWDGGKDKQRFINMPTDTWWRFNINPYPKKDEKSITLRAPIEIKPTAEVTVVHTPPVNRFREGWDFINGVWLRKADAEEDGKPKGDLPGLPTKGGEVSNPFQRPAEDPLDDPLPPLDATTPVDGRTTPLSNVEFLKQSLKNKGSTTDSNPSSNSGKKVLSLPAPNSKTSPSASSEKLSGSLNVWPKSTRPKVSYRNIAGINYITDNKTSAEWNRKELKENTDMKCCYCKNEVESEYNISEFISSKAFICMDCVEEPKAAVC